MADGIEEQAAGSGTGGDTPKRSRASAGRPGATVAQSWLVPAGGMVTTLAGLEATLVTVGSDAAALVAIIIGVLVVGALGVAAVDVWRNGR